MVNEILKEEMNEIHALTQKWLIPEQWEKMIAENPDLLNQKQHSNDPNAKCISHQHWTFEIIYHFFLLKNSLNLIKF